jgi:predicted secreted Zn-dependent protease
MKRLALAILLGLAACDRPPLEDRRGDAPGYAERALKPYPGTKLKFYLVEGVTPEALNESMREQNLAGLEQNGRFAVGVTKWNGGWRLPIRPDGMCDLSQVEVRFDVTVILPELANENATPEVRRKWGNFVADVVAHEAEHVRLIYEYRPRIEKAMRDATCQTAEAAGKAMMDELTAANARFDAESQAEQMQTGSPLFR